MKLNFAHKLVGVAVAAALGGTVGVTLFGHTTPEDPKSAVTQTQSVVENANQTYANMVKANPSYTNFNGWLKYENGLEIMIEAPETLEADFSEFNITDTKGDPLYPQSLTTFRVEIINKTANIIDVADFQTKGTVNETHSIDGYWAFFNTGEPTIVKPGETWMGHLANRLPIEKMTGELVLTINPKTPDNTYAPVRFVR